MSLSLLGTLVEYVGTTMLPADQKPVLLVGGQVMLGTPAGRLVPLTLTTHSVFLQDSKLEEVLQQQIALHRYHKIYFLHCF